MMSSKTKHLLIIEDSQGFQEYVLDASLHIIGRDPKCDIRLASQFVSRRHATLVQIPNGDGTYYYRLVDGTPKGKPSSNGMLINGRRVLACDLQDRDEIVFGPQVRAVYMMHEEEDERAVGFDDTIVPSVNWVNEMICG
jgi:pSer/pThr/pTyr-binding forkhead associated (FHA) protein